MTDLSINKNKHYKQLLLISDKNLVCALISNGIYPLRRYQNPPDFVPEYLFICRNDVRQMLREFKDGTLQSPVLSFLDELEEYEIWQTDLKMYTEHCLKYREENERAY